MTLQGKALIVEDSKTNQMLLSLILDDIGLEYEIANNAQEAVDMFTNSPKYDILMDENMPVMNGIEAVRKIREIEKKNSVRQSQLSLLRLMPLAETECGL